MQNDDPQDDQKQPIAGDQNYKAPDVVPDDGEGQVSGGAPAPESDDNTLDEAKKAGLYPNSGEDSQQPVDVAGQVGNAEEAHQKDDE